MPCLLCPSRLCAYRYSSKLTHCLFACCCLIQADLLPKQATAMRVAQWVRLRVQQAGLPRPDKVFCVSANKGSGVRDMVGAVYVSCSRGWSY